MADDRPQNGDKGDPPRDMETRTFGGGGERAPLPPTPRTIGPYRILGEIGHGGMGVVYEVEQERPVHRRVALKLIKRGMDTDEIVPVHELRDYLMTLVEMCYQSYGYRRVKNPRIWSLHDIAALSRDRG